MNSWHWTQVDAECISEQPIDGVNTLQDGDRLTADSGEVYFIRRTTDGAWFIERDGFYIVRPTDADGIYHGIQQLAYL